MHISSDEVFSKILKKPFIVQKKIIPHMKASGLFNKGPFTNYVYKRRGVGGQKNRLFVNFYTIENVNEGG